MKAVCIDGDSSENLFCNFNKKRWDIYRVSFIGHRDIEREVEIRDQLLYIVKDLIREKIYVDFQMGRNGDFDRLAASVVKEAKQIMGCANSSLTVVLPYTNVNMEWYDSYYDSIIIPANAQGTHYKSAIVKRNEWLVDNADLLISYVKTKTGGAATCLRYAKKKELKIINLAEIITDNYV